MLDRVEVEVRGRLVRTVGHGRGRGEGVMGQGVQIAVAAVQGEHRRAVAAGVVHPLQQPGARLLRRDDQQGLAAPGRRQPAEPHRQMGRRSAGDTMAHQGRRQLGQARPGGLVVEMGGQMPGLVRGAADQQQPPAVRGDGTAQRPREAAGGLHPLGPGEHLTQQGDPYGIHGPASCPRAAPSGCRFNERHPYGRWGGRPGR